MKRGIRLAASTTVVAAGWLAFGADTAGALRPQPEPPGTAHGVITAESTYGAPNLGFTTEVLGGLPAVQLPPSPCTPGYGVLTCTSRG